METLLDDFLHYIRSAGFDYTIVNKKPPTARIKISPKDVVAFKTKFLGERGYHSLEGKPYLGGVYKISTTMFNLVVKY